jgi:hypothetical protein
LTALQPALGLKVDPHYRGRFRSPYRHDCADR